MAEGVKHNLGCAKRTASVDLTDARKATVRRFGRSDRSALRVLANEKKKTNTRQMYCYLELGYAASDCPGCNGRRGRAGAEVRRAACPASNSCQAVYRG